MVLTLFFQAVYAIFRLEEITNLCYQQLEDERKRRVAAVQTLNIADQSNVELKKKLANEEHAHKSADSTLESAQKQAEDQRKRLHKATDQLAASKEQMAALKKQLEEPQRLKDQAEKVKAEAEKAKVKAKKAREEEAEQHSYDIGIAETEDTLRAEILTVCRAYCAQTWEEALNRAGVEASSELRRPKNVYFPPTIRASNLPSNQEEATFIVTDPAEEARTQDPLPPNQPEQSKEPKVPKDTSSDKAAEVLQDGAASQSFEQALTSTTIPAGEVPKEKKKVVPPEAVDKAFKSKLQIKLKP